MKKKLSVIIPIHNVITDFGQNFQDYVVDFLMHKSNSQHISEIIIIDDYSTDNSLNILRGVKKISEFGQFGFHRLPYGRTSGGNRSLVRNYGASIAKSNYLFFMDQDMVLSHNFMSVLFDYLSSFDLDNTAITGCRLEKKYGNEDFSIGSVESFPPEIFDVCECDFKTTRCCLNFFLSIHGGQSLNLINNMSEEVRKGIALHENPFMMVSYGLFVSKNVFERLGGFDTSFVGWGNEDVEFGYRMYKNGVKTLCCDRNLFMWHIDHPMDRNQILDDWLLNYIRMIDKHPEIAGITHFDSQLFSIAHDHFHVKTDVARNRVESKINGWAKACNVVNQSNANFFKKTDEMIDLEEAEKVIFTSRAQDPDDYLKWHRKRIDITKSFVHNLIQKDGRNSISILEYSPSPFFMSEIRKTLSSVTISHEVCHNKKFVNNGKIDGFDYIFAFNVFNYLWTINERNCIQYDGLKEFLVECYKHLAPGGLLVATMYNRMCAITLDRFLSGRIPLVWSPLPDSEGHIQELSCQDLLEISNPIFDKISISTDKTISYYEMNDRLDSLLQFMREKRSDNISEEWMEDTIFFTGRRDK